MTGLGALGQAYVSGAVSAATDVITQVQATGKGLDGLKDVNWKQTAFSFAVGAYSGAKGGMVSTIKKEMWFEIKMFMRMRKKVSRIENGQAQKEVNI